MAVEVMVLFKLHEKKDIDFVEHGDLYSELNSRLADLLTEAEDRISILAAKA